MKKLGYLFVSVLIISFYSCVNLEEKNEDGEEPLTEASSEREYYQLKIYSFDSEVQEAATDVYLRDAYLPALHRLGIENVGVFKPREYNSDTLRYLFILIPYKSMQEFEELEDKLNQDEQYTASGMDYLSASYDKPPYFRIESVLLKAFEDMPKMAPSTLKGPRQDRVYELRSYESATEELYRNKVDMFNAGGEITLFEELGFNAVFYAEVLSGAKMPNLMYMTTHSDTTARSNNWKNFVESPKWDKLVNDPNYQNNVSHADIWLLYPTEYSDY